MIGYWFISNQLLNIFLSCFLVDIGSSYCQNLNIACGTMSPVCIICNMSSSRLTVYEIEFAVAVYCCLAYQLLFSSFVLNI